MFFEWVGHHDEGFEHVWPHPRAHGGRDGAKVVAHDAIHLTISQGIDEYDNVSDQVGGGELGHICFGIDGVVPARGPAVAPLVEGHDIVAGVCQGGHHFPP